MKLSTEIDFSKFETVDVLVNPIKTVGANGTIVVAHLNGGDNGANLVEVVRNADGTLDLSVLMGTALSPARFIRTEHGIVPGLLYHGFVEIKVGYEVNGSGSLVNGREYWDLPTMGTSLNFYAKTNGKDAQWMSVLDGAYELFTRELNREVFDRHTTLEVRAVVVFDPRVPLDQLWMSRPIADHCMRLLASVLGDRAPKTYKELCGVLNRTLRYPLQDWNVIQELRIRVVMDDLLAFRINDVTIKLMDGDFDGDQLPMKLVERYLRSMDAQRDMGSLDIVEALPDPEKFESSDFSLWQVRAYEFPGAVMTAAGMGTKSLQGILTNGFTDLGIAAVVAYAQNPGMIASVLSADGLTAWADKPHTYIYNEFKQSLSPATAICLDYRKYDSDDNPERYAAALWNMVEVLSLGGEFSEAVGLVDKEHKTINIEAGNMLLRFTKDGLTPFLSQYAVQSNLRGDIDASTNEGKFDLRRIANMMEKESLAQFLRYASGTAIEAPGLQTKDPRGIKEDSATFSIGWDKEPITWDYVGGELAWDYIVRRAHWAGAENASHLTKVGGGKIIKLGEFVIELDPLEFKRVEPKASGNTIGFIRLISGESERYSRLILRSRNRNFGPSPTVHAVDLVTVLDLVAEELAQWEYRGLCEKKKYGTEFDSKAFNARIKTSVEQILMENSRLPGSTDKGTERVVGEINISSIQCSIKLGRGNTAMQTMQRNTALLTAIDENSFVSPLIPSMIHRFDVGMGSKNHPGTVATLLSPGMMRESRSGKRINYVPLKPVIQYAVNIWLDTDRQTRETLSVRMSCELDSPESIILNSGFNAAMPAITRRRRDGVWVAIPGKHWFFSDVEKNGDMGRLTPYGMSVFSRKSRPGLYGPLARHHADSMAQEILGDDAAVAEDLTAIGWKIKYSGRRMGRYGRKAQHEAQLTLTGPALGSPTWNKVYLHGHKFIATPTVKDYYLEVDGEMMPILGFVPIESLVQKKMTGTMAAGLAALLGHTYFGNSAESLIDPRRGYKVDENLQLILDDKGKKVFVGGDAPSKYRDIVSVAGKLLAEKNLPDTGMLPVHNEDGTYMGTGFGMILAGFVMREDDKLSTGAKTTGSNSLITMRACGDELTLTGAKDNRLSRHAQQNLTSLAQLIATGTVDPKGLTVLDAVEEDEEVGDDYPDFSAFEPDPSDIPDFE